MSDGDQKEWGWGGSYMQVTNPGAHSVNLLRYKFSKVMLSHILIESHYGALLFEKLCLTLGLFFSISFFDVGTLPPCPRSASPPWVRVVLELCVP